MDHMHGFNLSNSSPSQQPNTSSQSTPRHPPSQFTTNFPSQFSQQFQPQFPPNFNPFNPYGFQPPFNHFNIGGPYEGSYNLSPNRGFGRGAAVEGVRSSSPVESMPFFFAAGSSSPASPMSAAPRTNVDFSNQDWSDNSDAEEKKGGRMNWTEEENLKLISSWLHHSKDSIKGNSQRGENFWKNIVAEFNSNVTQVKAAAMAKAAEATERRANVDLLNKYLEMTAVDTTGFNDVQLQRHEIALNFLQRKLSDEK
ncbi:unnamed protein product [Urochloa decumbens]|uniref:Myb-like domain-containing protein n=1 Tax=Urochloa decumbens TaxID=240449 RepID=A0ABC9FRE8_9POAL